MSLLFPNHTIIYFVFVSFISKRFSSDQLAASLAASCILSDFVFLFQVSTKVESSTNLTSVATVLKSDSI